MLEKIGFFRFGRDHSEPRRALECALEKSHGAENALVVLPEAFNIAVPYQQREGKQNFDRMIVKELQALSERFKVAFVAGLVINEPCGPAPPRSAAYLVTNAGQSLICYKMGSDDTAGDNYTPCTRRADRNNPFAYEGVRIGTLICVDANPPTRYPAFHCRLQTVVNASDVVCVPAHMAKGNFQDGIAGCEISLIPPSSNKRLILANSRPGGINSFITDCNGRILEPTVGGEHNQVVTLPFGTPLSSS